MLISFLPMQKIDYKIIPAARIKKRVEIIANTLKSYFENLVFFVPVS